MNVQASFTVGPAPIAADTYNVQLLDGGAGLIAAQSFVGALPPTATFPSAPPTTGARVRVDHMNGAAVAARVDSALFDIPADVTIHVVTGVSVVILPP